MSLSNAAVELLEQEKKAYKKSRTKAARVAKAIADRNARINLSYSTPIAASPYRYFNIGLAEAITQTGQAYLRSIEVVVHHHYNPAYGGIMTCKCGHDYYRHFDTYEDMEPVGCKYCRCDHFEAA